MRRSIFFWRQSDEGNPPSALQSMVKVPVKLGYALRLVWRSGPQWSIINGILVMVQGLLPLAILYLTKLVIDAITSAQGTTEPVEVLLLVGLMGGAALIVAACRPLASYVNEAQSQAVTDHVQSLLHAKSVSIDLAYYETPRYYDKLYRAQQEAPFRPTRIVNGLVQLAQSALSLVAIGSLIFGLHWSIALVMVGAALPGAIVRLKNSDTLYRWRRNRTQAERRAGYFHWLMTSGEIAKEIRLFGLGGEFIKRFNALRTQLRTERMTIARRRAILETVSQLSVIAAIYWTYMVLAVNALQGEITVGDLVMYVQAFQRAQLHMNELLTSIAGLYEDNLFLSTLSEFLDLDPQVVDPPRLVTFPRAISDGIVFDNVGFTYPDADRPALKNVSMKIGAGEQVALVGHNGAGKTTLVKLLCRLYDPTNGRILLDGIDIKTMSVETLRSRISVVFQDFVRYHLSAHDNIKFGNIAVADSNPRFAHAVHASGADAVINALPAGYDTILGKMFEKGEELSIGEWQKIALARAFLRDSDVIVMDEPTSALDPIAEAEVFDRFRVLAHTKMALLISHRLSTVRRAGRIYVMEHGTIVESGTHDYLMQRDGLYARLFTLQASTYLENAS